MQRLLLAALIATLGSVGAQASTISYDVRAITGSGTPAPASTYAANWAAQTSSISVENLSNFNGAYGSNSGYDRLTVDFSVSAAYAGATAFFELAPDAGYGGELYLDGVLLDQKTYDLWWGGNWNATSQILGDNGVALSAGNHELQAYWAENCCNGAEGGRFSLNGQTWQDLSVANLNTLAAVPEPGTVAILGLGLAGLMVSRRRQGNANGRGSAAAIGFTNCPSPA